MSHTSSILNIRNDDNRCLLYCIAAYLQPVTGSRAVKETASAYDEWINVNIRGDSESSWPLEGSQDIRDFVALNRHLNFDLSIYRQYNVDITKIFSTKNIDKPSKYHIHLLEIQGYQAPICDGSPGECLSHYVLITDISSYLRKKYIYANSTSRSGTHICSICDLYKTRDLELLEAHKDSCRLNKTGQVNFYHV